MITPRPRDVDTALANALFPQPQFFDDSEGSRVSGPHKDFDAVKPLPNEDFFERESEGTRRNPTPRPLRTHPIPRVCGRY